MTASSTPCSGAISTTLTGRLRLVARRLALLAALLVSVLVAAPVAAGGRPTGLRVAVFATTFGGGVYRRDGAAPWRRLWQSPDPDSQGSRVWSFLAADEGRRLYASGATGTLWRSVDGGRTWRRTERGLDSGSRSTLDHLQADPRDPRVLYADGYGGLYETSDGGDTWRRPARGLPNSYVCLMALNRPTGDSLWANNAVRLKYDRPAWL